MVDGCGIVVCGTKCANVGFVFRYCIASFRAVQLTKEAAAVLMLSDPRQAPLLYLSRSELFEDDSILIGKNALS